jgi:hypothetical protein
MRKGNYKIDVAGTDFIFICGFKFTNVIYQPRSGT